MKRKTISLNTNYWANKTISCPYECLGEVFSDATISEFKNDLNDYFSYAIKDEVYNKRSASSAMYNCAVLLSLLKACYKIYLKSKKSEVKRVLKEDVLYEFYCLSSLSKEEYINPNLALKNVFDEIEFDDIEVSLFDTIRNAMCPSIDECFQDNFVQIPMYYKLLEGCWLINERLKEKD